MDPDKKTRMVRIISQVVLAVIGVSLVYAWGLNRDHSTFANVGFCASMLLILAVYFLVNRRFRG